MSEQDKTGRSYNAQISGGVSGQLIQGDGNVQVHTAAGTREVSEADLAAVRALIPAAHIAYVIRDAVDVRSVVHLGRQVTAHQRTAPSPRGTRSTSTPSFRARRAVTRGAAGATSPSHGLAGTSACRV